MKKVITSLCAAALCAGMNAQVNINIDAHERGVEVSPTLYGIFFEEINHAGDGGLYAELIRNRSFEESAEKPDYWKADGSSIALNKTKLLNAIQKADLKWTLPKGTSSSKPATLTNEGYWGINAVQGRTYKLTLFAKADGKYKGNLTAQLRNAETGQVYASAPVKGTINGKYQKLTAELTAQANDPKAVFTLTADAPGTLYVDVVSLFPPTFKNRENGCRPDLAQLLADLKPAFMRFPGGCYVEGQKTEENMFKWKRTIGAIEERPGHRNENWSYEVTDGLGYHEFLQLAEDLGAEPLFVVNIGIWHGGCLPYDKIDAYVQDALDAIEYANGDATTKYGAMRIANGHPEPFNLRLLEIGNENYNFSMDNNRDQSDHYPERYITFYKAIKEKYPYIQCIGNVEAWGTDTPSWRNNHPVDLLDEHYYRSPMWFGKNFHKYDNYDRKEPKIYVGEYAVTQGFGTKGNLDAALGEAVYMMGMENNSDVVTMNSYAPIFVNENSVQWQPDMIRFNSSKVMCTPSYYVQKMMPNNVGTQMLTVSQSVVKGVEKQEPFQPVKVGYATWETSASFKDLTVKDSKGNTVALAGNVEGKSGEWKTESGVTTQASNRQSCVAVNGTAINDSVYTLSCKARVNNGAEGFILVFNYKDDKNYSWFNCGGWGNTQTAMENTTDGAKNQFGSRSKMTLKADQWYDVRIEVAGNKAVCYVDDKKVCEGTIAKEERSIFSNASINDATGEVFVKVVNMTDQNNTAIINTKNLNIKSGTVLRLSADSASAENSMETPTNVVPVEGGISINNGTVTADLPAYSVNIVKLQTK
jgi:alpha-L-arabinofuranosidase